MAELPKFGDKLLSSSYKKQADATKWLQNNDIMDSCKKVLFAAQLQREKKKRYPPMLEEEFKIIMDDCITKLRLTVAQRKHFVAEGMTIPTLIHVQVWCVYLCLTYKLKKKKLFAENKKFVF